MPDRAMGITLGVPGGTSVITIGNFDGCHLGHAALVERARSLASMSGGRVVVMSFDPHPASVLRPGAEPARLTTWERRVQLLESLGADEVVRLEPTPDFLSLDPLEFAEQHLIPRGVTHVVEGPDFRFGSKRTGDLDVLRAIGEGHGFEVAPVEPVMGVTSDHLEFAISSSVIRRLIGDGRVRDAAAMLGRPHRVVGEVVRGARLGRTIGVPTANVRCETMTPGEGVYAGRADLPNGESYPAAINMGTRPTVDGVDERFEVHLIGAKADGERLHGLDEYGWTIGVDLVGRIRDQVRFESVEALRSQLARDVERVPEVLGRTISAGAPA